MKDNFKANLVFIFTNMFLCIFYISSLYVSHWAIKILNMPLGSAVFAYILFVSVVIRYIYQRYICISKSEHFVGCRLCEEKGVELKDLREFVDNIVKDDCRIPVEIEDMDENTFLELAKIAHENDTTINNIANEALKIYMNNKNKGINDER